MRRCALPALSLPAALFASACIESSARSGASPDSSSIAPRSAPVVNAVRVNRGTYGMTARVRWLMSPDSSNILAVVDPAGVEAEALPIGFFYGSESRNFQAQMDSVWDVAPSPGWGMIAFSRAYVMHPREQDSIPASMYQDVARRSGLDAATVRASSFASSGMSMARAIAQPGTIAVPADARGATAADRAAPRTYPVATGWRVRWTTDTLIALGNSPARVQDDAPSETWASLDPRTGAFHGSLPAGARLIDLDWKQGPAIDISSPVDLSSAPPLSAEGGGRSWTIRSERGVITAIETTAGADSTRSHTIGPGKALAVTRGGRYILALAPRTRAQPYEPAVEAVVYVVGW